jgi:hypothetical protein
MFEYESRSDELLPWPSFLRRLAISLSLAGIFVAFALTIGTAGYYYFARLPVLDAFLNASMILTGMGPVDPLRTKSAKLFASFYALFSGVIFITIMGVLLAPLLHRMMHKFHLEPDENDDNSQ